MNKRFSKHRPRLGVLIRRVSDEYMTWSGMINAAARNDADLLIFAGGSLESPVPYEEQANRLYDLVGSANVDGLLVNSDLLGHFSGPEKMGTFVDGFAPLPRVKFEDPTPGVPTLIVDFYHGMYEVVSHLIEVHSCKRIAFIKGSEKSHSGHRRYQGYCDALADHGIELDENLIVPGGMWPPAGKEGVRRLLDGRRLRPGTDFDALAVVNEFVALDALAELQERGVRIPQDITFTAFDNMQEAVSVTPPLTTANLPVHEMGEWSIETLLAMLRDEEVPPVTVMPAKLVVRQSCGCPNPVLTARVPFPQDDSGSDCGAINPEWLDQRLLGVDQPVAMTIPRETWHHVSSSLCLALKQHQPEVFISAVELGVAAEAHDPRKASIWHRLLAQLRIEVLTRLESSQQRALAEELLQQAHALVGEISVRAQEHKKSESRLLNQRMAEVSQLITTAVSLEELADILAENLPLLGIPSAYISLYDDPVDRKGSARLFMAYDKRGRISIGTGGWDFPVNELYPERLHPTDRQTVMVIEPLYHRSEQQGLAVFEVGPAEGALYDVLRGQISSAIRNVVLYCEALKARREAEEANRLKTRFLTTVGHELRTPLSLIVSLSEMVLSNEQKKTQPLPESIRREMEVIHATGQHLDRLLRDVLDLGRSQLGKLELVWREIDVVELVNETALVGERLAGEKGLEWHLVIPPALPKLQGDRTRLQQVLLNLISNACKFTNQGSVTLAVDQQPGLVTFSVIDTGLGVPVNEQESIFDEFSQSQRTTARGYGGMGLGLAITRQLVELHGGKIGLRSSGKEGEGACFYFILPVQPDEMMLEAPQESLDNLSQTVLLLTEHRGKAQTLLAHLVENGFKVMEVAVDDDERWLAQVGAVRPGALLVDNQSGTNWGFELAQRIINTPETQHIPILFYSLPADDSEGGLLELNTLAKPLAVKSLSQAMVNYGLTSRKNHGKHPLILSVDDAPEILALHTRQLHEVLPDAQILEARNGLEALSLMENSRPDLVLLDLMMPEMDGFGVLEVMRTKESLRDIPVIILTAQSVTEEMIKRLSRGVAAVMSKGLFSQPELLAHIENVLTRHKHLGSEAQRIARRAMVYIQAHYAEKITRTQMAAHIGVNERYLTRCFHAETGLTPVEYLTRCRIQYARSLLDEGKSVTETALAVGFDSGAYFSRVFSNQVGVSPREYAQGDKPCQ